MRTGWVRKAVPLFLRCHRRQRERCVGLGNFALRSLFFCPPEKFPFLWAKGELQPSQPLFCCAQTPFTKSSSLPPRKEALVGLLVAPLPSEKEGRATLYSGKTRLPTSGPGLPPDGAGRAIMWCFTSDSLGVSKRRPRKSLVRKGSHYTLSTSLYSSI